MTLKVSGVSPDDLPHLVLSSEITTDLKNKALSLKGNHKRK
jgi:hypothetical protein